MGEDVGAWEGAACVFSLAVVTFLALVLVVRVLAVLACAPAVVFGRALFDATLLFSRSALSSSGFSSLCIAAVFLVAAAVLRVRAGFSLGSTSKLLPAEVAAAV